MRAALLMVLALTQFPSAREVFDLGRTHDEALFESLYPRMTTPAVIEFLVWHPSNPSSVVAAITQARENARSVRDQILSLPANCLLYPAHDYKGLTVTSVGEERRFNPRFGGDSSLGDFVGYMRSLGLPHPKIPLPRDLYGTVENGARANSAGIDLANEQRLASLSSALLAGTSTVWAAEPTIGDAPYAIDLNAE